MDWKDALQQFADLNPDLPAGEDTPATQSTATAPKRKEKLQVVMERKGRAGKTATIVAGFECDDTELRTVLSALQKRLGTGGSARGGEILIQGDWREKVKPVLREMGYKI